MKIAIHHRPDSYSEQWIEYCQQHNIQYKIVDAYANDILEQVADCDAFMWNFNNNIYKDHLLAKQLIYTIQQMGKTVYPDYDTCWHYDDKVGQKYLLKSINAPLVPTYIFFRREEAYNWIKQTKFPKVFKLRSGASSKNVMLIKNARQAYKITSKAFCRGFQKNNHLRRIADRWIQYKKGFCTFKWFIKGIFSITPYKERFNKEEIGYVYFQDFVPNNNCDIRIFIIGNRAVFAKRMNMKNDFRASGSHNAVFDKEQMDIEFIKYGFNISKSLKMQSVAFDFLQDTDGNPILAEISYYCGNNDYSPNGGYWTDDMQWNECKNINIGNWIIEDVIAKIENK